MYYSDFLMVDFETINSGQEWSSKLVNTCSKLEVKPLDEYFGCWAECLQS